MKKKIRTPFLWVILLIFSFSWPLFSSISRGQITKKTDKGYIINVGTQLRARRGDYFYVYRIVNWRRIKVGILKIKDVYYESSLGIVPFGKPPFFRAKVGDEVEKAQLPIKEIKRVSLDYLRDMIEVAQKNENWNQYLEKVIFYLLKKETNDSWAKYKLARYYLYRGLYGDAYLSLKYLKKSSDFPLPQWIEAMLLKAILEYQYGSHKRGMEILGNVVKMKLETKKNKKGQRKVKPVYEDIFLNPSSKEENNLKTDLNLKERLFRRKVIVMKKVALLLRGFFLEKEGYQSFSNIVLSDFKFDRIVLERAAEVFRYFPQLKREFVEFLKRKVVELD